MRSILSAEYYRMVVIRVQQGERGRHESDVAADARLQHDVANVRLARDDAAVVVEGLAQTCETALRAVRHSVAGTDLARVLRAIPVADGATGATATVADVEAVRQRVQHLGESTFSAAVLVQREMEFRLIPLR